jgi:hypothetical protein
MKRILLDQGLAPHAATILGQCSASRILSMIEIVWGRMASCAAVGNRRRFAHKAHKAD